VGIVTVENGVIVDEFVSLIKPPNNLYSPFTIQVHGIYPRDTVNAKSFTQVFPEIQRRLQNRVVVAHNESFDRNVLQINGAVWLKLRRFESIASMGMYR
jgi:DNA polymerase-3 subunit epsilon